MSNVDRLALPETHFPKAERLMRALRRGLLAYWYATLEDPEAATIEAVTTTLYVNILDEAVFESAHGDAYRRLRADDPLGLVVTGLELIRNCETHSPIVFDGLLDERMRFGVPSEGGVDHARSVFVWAPYDRLPPDYREASSSATETQQRARGEAQHGYRQAIQTRSVIETLFDAMAFFESLDSRFIGAPSPEMRWAYCELPDNDPQLAEPAAWYLARPMGLDRFEPFLPDIACRSIERRSARWPAADRSIDALAQQAKSEPPTAPGREVMHVLVNEGRIVGYSGFSTTVEGHRSSWVERRQQVWRDVRNEYRYYFVSEDGTEIDLQVTGHEAVDAIDAEGQGALAHLTESTEWALGIDRLRMVEDYRDLYLEMRRSD